MGWNRSSSWGLVVVALLLLGACGGSGSSSDPGGDSTVTVRGTVISQMLEPIPAVPVAIEGHPLVVTDVDGRFEVSGVTPPYTAIVMEMDTNTATIYQGLTRPDPYLLRRYVTDIFSGPRWANVKGTVFGGTGFPTAAAISTSLYFSALYADWVQGASVSPLTGEFDPVFVFLWAGPVECPAFLHAIQSELSGPRVLSYVGYGRRYLDVYDEEVVLNQALHLEPVPTYEHSGTVTVPSGVTLGRKQAYLAPSPGEAIPVDGVTDSLSTFTLRSPGVPGATASIACWGSVADGAVSVYRQGLTGDTSGMQITIPEPPVLLQPADGATNIGYDTLFTFTALPQTVREVQIYGDASNYSGPNLFILTTADEVRIPDLRVYGLGLQPSSLGTWSVNGYGPLDTVDQAAGPDSLWPLDVQERFQCLTHSRVFTSEP